MQLMPYGSSGHAGLVAKVSVSKGDARQDAGLMPYGDAANSALAAKVGYMSKAPANAPKARRVTRLGARS